MLSKLIPKALKRRFTDRVRFIARGAQQDLYLESNRNQQSYAVVLSPDNSHQQVRAEELLLGYGDSENDYLSGGKRDCLAMTDILTTCGADVETWSRILEFGCGGGRMIRHLPELTPAELWGVDIDAGKIRWCMDHLAPRIHFATTTTVAHLPFEDRYFDMIFSGSVFTHIEDTQEAWLLELARLLRPNGWLYLTIHDENTVSMLENERRDHWLAQMLSTDEVYQANKSNFSRIIIGRGARSQVFYESNYFRSLVPPMMKWIALVPKAYGYQSAVLLQRQ